MNVPLFVVYLLFTFVVSHFSEIVVGCVPVSFSYSSQLICCEHRNTVLNSSLSNELDDRQLYSTFRFAVQL